MKSFRAIFLLLARFCLAQPSTLNSQPAPTNRVLELDGAGGYVELPPNIFNDLDEATVEAWVRWDAPLSERHAGGHEQFREQPPQRVCRRDSHSLPIVGAGSPSTTRSTQS